MPTDMNFGGSNMNPMMPNNINPLAFNDFMSNMMKMFMMSNNSLAGATGGMATPNSMNFPPLGNPQMNNNLMNMDTFNPSTVPNSLFVRPNTSSGNNNMSNGMGNFNNNNVYGG
jgi:hypothetical protein